MIFGKRHKVCCNQCRTTARTLTFKVGIIYQSIAVVVNTICTNFGSSGVYLQRPTIQGTAIAVNLVCRCQRPSTITTFSDEQTKRAKRRVSTVICHWARHRGVSRPRVVKVFDDIVIVCTSITYQLHRCTFRTRQKHLHVAYPSMRYIQVQDIYIRNPTAVCNRNRRGYHTWQTRTNRFRNIGTRISLHRRLRFCR